MIQFSDVTKSYNPGLFKKKVTAVKALDLNVRQGEVFGLIGPNGAGKSTTIRMLLGLIRPDAGTIRYQDKLLNEVDLHRDIGYLPENPYLYDHLTLLELLDFCGRTSALESSRISERGAELMSKLDLSEVQRRPLRTFSKGMLQRAGICFALLHDPSIVVLDEPMSGLDPIGRKMVFDLVVELKQQGKTIFFCSHILNDVERLCDRVSLINKGELIREFEREDLLPTQGKSIFLHTENLSSEQLDKLKSQGIMLREESGGHLLAIPEDKYYEINSYLREMNIAVLGCRSEWISLEELFMHSVKGGAR